MKAPGRVDRALARRGGAKVYGCLTALGIYGAATGQVPWLLPVLTGVLTIAARKARAEVTAYDSWTGTWNELQGPQPRRPKPRGRSRAPMAGRLFLFTLLLLPAVWLVTRAQDGGVPLGVCLAGLFALTLAARLAMRLVPGLRRPAGFGPAQRPREFTVAIWPALPAPAPRPGIAALPPYARALLARQAAPAPAAQPTTPRPRPEDRPN